MGQFGDKFRKEREKKNISLDDVSNVTKISSRMLKAIEDEHFDQLPGGVFNKGFIRAYAKHLGMNDDEAVNGYLACVRQAEIDAHQAWETSERTSAKRPPAPPSKSAAKTQPPTEADELPELHLPRAEHVRPPAKKYLDDPDNGIPWRLVAVALLVVILAIILWVRHSHRRISVAAAPPTTPVSQSAPAPTTSSSAAALAPNPSSHPIPSNTNPPSPKSTPAVAPAKTASTTAQSNATAPISTTPPPAPKPLSLVIRASENSWVSISADGQPIRQENLIAPAHTSVRANNEIVVRVGNAAGVTFLWNGQELPAQGAEAEVKTLVFDSDGLRPASPTPQ